MSPSTVVVHGIDQQVVPQYAQVVRTTVCFQSRQLFPIAFHCVLLTESRGHPVAVGHGHELPFPGLNNFTDAKAFWMAVDLRAGHQHETGLVETVDGVPVPMQELQGIVPLFASLAGKAKHHEHQIPDARWGRRR